MVSLWQLGLLSCVERLFHLWELQVMELEAQSRGFTLMCSAAENNNNNKSLGPE